jgi:hypothetical protein
VPFQIRFTELYTVRISEVSHNLQQVANVGTGKSCDGLVKDQAELMQAAFNQLYAWAELVPQSTVD